MIPSEYQELASFFVDRLDRYQRETRETIAANQKEMRNHFGALFESLRHEIRLVADGVQDAHRRLDENTRATNANTRAIEDLGTRVDANTDRIDANTRAIEDLSTRVDANTDRIDANTRAIENNGARIDANGRRIDALTQRVERLETTVSGRFDDHEARLRALEG